MPDPKIGRGGVPSTIFGSESDFGAQKPIMGDYSDLPTPVMAAKTNFGIDVRLTGSRGSYQNRSLRDFPIWPQRVATRWEFRRLGTSRVVYRSHVW